MNNHNQVTFNSDENSPPPLAFKQTTSNSNIPLEKSQKDFFIPEGTGRFSEDNENNSHIGKPQSQLKSQIMTKNNLRNDDYYVQEPQKGQDRMTGQYHSCPEHEDREIENVCVKIGCMRINPLLCSECTESHLCDQIVPYSQFVKTMNSKFDSLDGNTFAVLDNEKQNLSSDLQKFFKQLVQQFQLQIQLLEPFILKKILSDQHNKLELKGSFLQSLFKTDLFKLNQKRGWQSLSTDEVQVVKIIYNDFMQLQDFSKIFLQEKDQLYKRLVEVKQDIFTLTTNASRHIEELLDGEIKHLTEDQITLNKPSQTTQQINKQIETLLIKIKEVQTLNVHKGEHIIDFCHVSETLVASGSDKGDIIIWKLPFFSEVCRFQHGIECTSLATCQDEIKQKFLISAYNILLIIKQSGRTNQQYQIFLWNIELRTKVVEVTGHNHPLRKVIPLPKQRLAWCAQDHIVRIWNLKERTQESEIKKHTAWINDLCRLSDTVMASCSRDQTVVVFDFESGKIKFQLKEETFVNCLCLVTTETFAFGNYNGSIKIYQNEFPIQMYHFRVNTNWIESNCIWSINRISDSFLAISSTNGKVNLWNLNNQKQPNLKEIDIFSSKISQAMLWLPKQKQLLTSSNSSIKVYQ